MNFTFWTGLAKIFFRGKKSLSVDDEAYLGFRYSEGVNCKKNHRKAFVYLERAAKKGHPKALFDLGRMYMDGSGVEFNYKKALHYFELSALANSAPAQHFLGVLLLSGVFEAVDYENGCKWLSLSASQGNVASQLYLANHFLMQREYENARTWFTLAASNRNGYAKDFILGSSETQLAIGNRYAAGVGVEQNADMAIAWYLQAAKKGDIEAQQILATTLLVNNRQREAIYWYTMAAEAGDTFSQSRGADFYITGKYVPRDYGLAFKWCCKAAENGDAHAQHNLGRIYERGLGVKKDIDAARYWYGQSASQNYEMAIADLKLLKESEMTMDKLPHELYNQIIDMLDPDSTKDTILLPDDAAIPNDLPDKVWVFFMGIQGNMLTTNDDKATSLIEMLEAREPISDNLLLNWAPLTNEELDRYLN